MNLNSNDNLTDITTVLDIASEIEHPTMEDSTYGQFLAIGGMYSTAHTVNGSMMFLDYLGEQQANKPTEENAKRIAEVEARIESATQMYHIFEQYADGLEITPDADEIVERFKEQKATLQEMKDSSMDELEMEAALLGVSVDEVIASETMHNAKINRRLMDRAERTSKWVQSHKDLVVRKLTMNTDDHVQLSDADAKRYLDKMSMKIGNPPSRAKDADDLGYKFKAWNISKENADKAKTASAINPLLAKEYSDVAGAAKSAVALLTNLEDHLNTLIRKLGESLEIQKPAKEGVIH